MQGPLGPGGSHPALLTDFGVAKLIDSPRRTRATKIIGTPDYLAPEIVEGLPPRAAVDIYALATVLYELLAGFTPFGGGHPGAVLRRHVTETVVPLPGIPEELWQLLVQCLAKAPASRLRASELAERLRSSCPCWPGCRHWTWTSRTPTRTGAGGDPGPAARSARAGTAGGRAPRTGCQAGLQPGHAYVDAGARAGRARGRRHVARPARRVPAGRPGPGPPGTGRPRRRRRLTLAAAGVALVAAVGVGTWRPRRDDDAGATPAGHEELGTGFARDGFGCPPGRGGVLGAGRPWLGALPAPLRTGWGGA
jgi:serine/threonine-protein kinase